ncbi:MAG TPA: spermidine/putrescine ABC transporter substrate-binding protein [Candidatus Babeliales bacterium]|nr:spermidine/putrescine ABC transporter substrate-binding protein [Candidatus Babeliales bacterium]
MKRLYGVVYIRTLIVLFWALVLFLFLMLPAFSRFFYEKKSISILIWPMILDTTVLRQFEAETGIKVYVNYYESNPELYSKLTSIKEHGYDLISPTDYMVELLIQEKIVQKIDVSKLSFIDDIRPEFRNLYFDPRNEYSIPYYVGVFGLGINKQVINRDLEGLDWDFVFDTKQISYPICMPDDPRQVAMLASKYIFGTIDALRSPEAIQQVRDLLIEQKKFVQVYSEARADELLASGSCPVVVGISSDVWKVMREDENITFVVPKSGTFASLELLTIPQSTKKTDLVYQLLNFLYRAEVLKHNSIRYGFCPPLVTVPVESKNVLCITSEQMSSMSFFKNVLSNDEIQDLWISVLSY